ncbi:MAG: hypothetical protein LBM99_06525, partial [Bacillales bacterium]|nr:hypothetical protein [Bacillales bacterium]
KPDYWWAFTYLDQDNIIADRKSPNASIYAWSSIDFMYDGYGRSLDAHTYIHETGHILGLPDYYDMQSESSIGALGGLDMMDFNIGDHNAYSKYMFNWVNPEIVKENKVVNLKPTSESGEFVILPTINYNGTPFAEYLMLEYLTPTALNEKDSHGYAGNNSAMYQEPGIRLTHVDSRIAKFSNITGDFIEYTDTLQLSKEVFTDIAHSNTPSLSSGKNNIFEQIRLIRQVGFETEFYSSQDDLFYEGDVFDIQEEKYANYFYYSGKFNNKESIKYKIKVNTLDSNYANISIEVGK